MRRHRSTHLPVLAARFNEHFRAAWGTELYVRVYLDGKYYVAGADDSRCELTLTAAIAEGGCPVAVPIPRRDGELLSVADVRGQPRRLSVFIVAPGGVKNDPTTQDAARSAERSG